MSLLVLTCAVYLWLSLPAYAVDKGNFKTCDQSGFCRWAMIRVTACVGGRRRSRMLLQRCSKYFARVYRHSL